MLARRMLMFVVVLFAITALAAAFAPPPPRQSVELPSILAPAQRPSGVVTRTVDAGAATVATITVKQGDRLDLSVTGTALDSVELEGLGGIRPIGPDAVANFDVVADDAGTYPVVLVSSGKAIARIDVTPPPREGLAPAGPLIHRTKDT